MKQKVCMSLIIAMACLIFVIRSSAQTGYQQFYLTREDFDLSTLRNEFGDNKIIPAGIELECLAALSFYPELKNTDLEFRFGKLNFTMICKPKFNSMLKDRTQRRYVIILQEPGLSKNNLEWKELSFNAMVGWIGHELGHVLHYSNKSSGGVFFMGIKYAVPGYRRKMERFADQLAIQHDLGYALYEGVDYTINVSHASQHYKKSQERFYLHTGEIIARIHSTKTWTTVFRKTRMEGHIGIELPGQPSEF